MHCLKNEKQKHSYLLNERRYRQKFYRFEFQEPGRYTNNKIRKVGESFGDWQNGNKAIIVLPAWPLGHRWGWEKSEPSSPRTGNGLSRSWGWVGGSLSALFDTWRDTCWFPPKYNKKEFDDLKLIKRTKRQQRHVTFLSMIRSSWKEKRQRRHVAFPSMKRGAHEKN